MNPQSPATVLLTNLISDLVNFWKGKIGNSWGELGWSEAKEKPLPRAALANPLVEIGGVACTPDNPPRLILGKVNDQKPFHPRLGDKQTRLTQTGVESKHPKESEQHQSQLGIDQKDKRRKRKPEKKKQGNNNRHDQKHKSAKENPPNSKRKGEKPTKQSVIPKKRNEKVAEH